jgi:hypothetical protein
VEGGLFDLYTSTKPMKIERDFMHIIPRYAFSYYNPLVVNRDIFLCTYLDFDKEKDLTFMGKFTYAI